MQDAWADDPHPVVVEDFRRVTGFDDLAYARGSKTPLTTVRQPCEELGRVAVRALVERILHRDLPPRHPLWVHFREMRSASPLGAFPGPRGDARGTRGSDPSGWLEWWGSRGAYTSSKIEKENEMQTIEEVKGHCKFVADGIAGAAHGFWGVMLVPTELARSV